jgi:hypothetical protein
MGLFSSKERNNLTKLLSTASSQDKVMTLDELYGFLLSVNQMKLCSPSIALQTAGLI